MTGEQVAERFRGRRNGTGWIAKCPAHKDDTPSLSISESKSDGRVLIHCHAGCATERVLAEAGLAMCELFPQAGSSPRIVEEYPYLDEHGKLLFQVVRFEPKRFCQRRLAANGKWVWDLKGVRRNLYRLPDLLSADFVLIVEGEKDVETGVKLGLVATCNPGGAGKWRNDYSETLRGKQVAIIADADEPGWKHARTVAASLRGKAQSVKLLGLPDAKDLSEWVQHGGTAAELWELIHTAPTWDLQFDRSGTPDWPDPKPIQAELRPVPSFDSNALLPDALRPWVVDEADRMPCAPDFVAAAALVALGAVIGARCAIKPKAKDDWMVVPNLWGGLVGLPSAKKSPAIGVALKPIEQLIKYAIEAHKEDTEAFEIAKTAFEARKEVLECRIKTEAKAKHDKPGNLESIIRELTEHKRSAPLAPVLRRYKTNDSTGEKLGELLRDNTFGLLVLRDELVGLLLSWEREGRECERTFYLEAWNGSCSFDTDRIGRGSIFIPNLCLSVFGGIQPDKLTSYLEQATNALANDGMLQRFQVLVYPDHRKWEWCDRSPDNQARKRAFAIFEALAAFDPLTWGASPACGLGKFPYFSFDAAAQEIFIEWSSDLHRRRIPAEDHPIIAQHLAKFDKLFPALALVLHLVDCAATGERGLVSAKAALRAAAWCDYLEFHARRCYGLIIDNGLRAALALADKVRQHKLPDGFTARDVRRNQWRSITTDESVQAAIDWLEDEGWLRAARVGGGGPGRRTNRYFINPKIREVAKRGPANTAENDISSVLAVPHLGNPRHLEALA